MKHMIYTIFITSRILSPQMLCIDIVRRHLFSHIDREYMVDAEVDRVYPVRPRKLRRKALASPRECSGQAR